MKKFIFISSVLFVMNLSAQNLILNNLTNTNINQQRLVQSQQVFASNLMVDDNNANSNQRVQRRTNSNPVQTNIINVLNTDLQMQGNFSSIINNNSGNSFGNENNMIEQIASVNIPAIQLGTGNVDLNLGVNIPKVKLPSIKFSFSRSVCSSKHKSFFFRNKLAKFNRNLTGKFSFGKKLKIKVDNCFKF